MAAFRAERHARFRHIVSALKATQTSAERDAGPGGRPDCTSRPGAPRPPPGGRIWRQGSVRLPREQVHSTTGAGDAFAVGVIWGLHEGWPVEQCLRLAVASAAACVRSPHTSDGIKRAEACLAETGRAGYRPVSRWRS